ncbi:glycosyltransferase family 2 protein [Candidatus Roizmanbacteria bacterium]|nr:glycosyltransferase family 2 protein [Candidatus Roizmanbacteria bacterium]
MKLSLCIATYNEESNIHYPLDSAYDLVDEVIIVDGGSNDKTIEKAQSYGDKVKVYNEDNPPMFHINKQKAIERARGEWILQLDADEALSDELKSEIKEVVRRKDVSRSTFHVSQAIAYWIPRKNFFLTRFLMKGGQYPDYTIRLYKNGVAHFPCKDVHENVEVKGEIGYFKNPILHYADPNFTRYLTRWNRYTTLEAEQMVRARLSFLSYFVIKPKLTFLSIYFRHLGLVDGFPGFVFALFSSIRFWAIYVKWWLKMRGLSRLSRD